MSELPRLDRPINLTGFIRVEKNAKKYGIPMGIYPVIYFEMYSVQIPVILSIDDPDFMYIDREDIDEWIEFQFQSPYGN